MITEEKFSSGHGITITFPSAIDPIQRETRIALFSSWNVTWSPKSFQVAPMIWFFRLWSNTCLQYIHSLSDPLTLLYLDDLRGFFHKHIKFCPQFFVKVLFCFSKRIARLIPSKVSCWNWSLRQRPWILLYGLFCFGV